MKTKFLLFSFLFMLCLNCYTKAQTDVNDSLALVALYKSTNGPSWKHHTNWLKGPVNTWYGISVTGTRVTAVSLGLNKLSGTLPAALGNLTALQELILYYNTLTGSLPATLGKLTHLQKLWLNNNSLSGSIPSSLGNLSNIIYFSLDHNALTGSIPTSLTKLLTVQNFTLDYNQLSGSIPDDIGNFQACWYLLLNNNHLSGTIPGSVTRLTTIVDLDVSFNNLSGQMPDITKLEFSANAGVYLNNNHLTNEFQPSTSAQRTTVVSNNNLTFTGLEKLLNYGGFLYPSVDYSNQAPVKLHSNGNQLSVSAGGTLSNNTYTWYKTGSTNTTVVTGDSTFQPAASGQYYAAITNAIARQLTLYTDTVSYTAPLQKPLSVSIYPNPVKGIVTITGLNAKGTGTITIADVSGTVWMKTVARQQSTVKCDVSRLKQGNYVLCVSNGQERITVNFMKE